MEPWNVLIYSIHVVKLSARHHVKITFIKLYNTYIYIITHSLSLKIVKDFAKKLAGLNSVVSCGYIQVNVNVNGYLTDNAFGGSEEAVI